MGDFELNELIQIKGKHGEPDSEHLFIYVQETSFCLKKVTIYSNGESADESITLPLHLWKTISLYLNIKNRRVMDDMMAYLESELNIKVKRS